MRRNKVRDKCQLRRRVESSRKKARNERAATRVRDSHEDHREHDRDEDEDDDDFLEDGGGGLRRRSDGLLLFQAEGEVAGGEGRGVFAVARIRVMRWKLEGRGGGSRGEPASEADAGPGGTKGKR